ncbi:MAG TPA: A/G-specific adenine glycosylase [Chloroflexi bacterium]|nr:A/G-specific adenine glycosylase [Chloroflexota bacterium]
MTTPWNSEFRVLFVERLLAWFAAHARPLPWRQDRTPYRVWVAEVMLQQTQVRTVVPYYERFLARFPTVQAVADAPLEQVLKTWEGLGYYARARHLYAAARQIVDRCDGQIPGTFDELLALPGVGRYTAGAVASIAFGQDVPAVDGNGRRVLCRVLDVRDDVPRSATQRKLEGLTRDLLPSGRAGVFNEALMELGATVCTPRAPDCAHCPLQTLCQAHAEGTPEALPVRPLRRRPPHYDVTAAVTLQADGRVLVAQRMPDDLLGGLWEFPGGKQEDGETLTECLVREMQEEMGVHVEVGESVAVVEHAYTHFRITLHAFCCRLVDGEPCCLECADFRWVTLGELDELPMSVVNRKVVQAVQELGCAGLFGRL